MEPCDKLLILQMCVWINIMNIVYFAITIIKETDANVDIVHFAISACEWKNKS